MNTRKTIIFSINELTQIYSEFHCNTSISLLKSYFRDITGIIKFSLIFNGKCLNNDSLKIRNLLNKNSTSKTLIFQVTANHEVNDKEMLMKTQYETNKDNEEILNLSNSIKDENEILRKKDIENIEIIKAFTQERNAFALERDMLNKRIEELIKGKKIAEEELLAARLQITTLALENEDLKKEISIQNYITFAPLDDNQVFNEKQLFNDETVQSYQDIIFESTVNQSVSNKEIEQFFEFNNKIDSFWYCIAPYLTLNDQANVSLTSRHLWQLTSKCWLDNISSKILLKEEELNKSIEQYSSLFTTNNQFIISHFSNSALMILKNATHSQIFSEEQHSLFHGTMQICMYQVLLQLTKILQDSSDFDNDTFINKLLTIFNQGIQTHKGLGEFLRFILKNFDFSFNNINHAWNIMKKHGISSINSSDISKDNKTSGIISFLCKDMLFFCGIEENSKKNNNNERFNFFKEIQTNTDIIQNWKTIQSQLANRINNKSF